MKVLSLKQPFAELILEGRKTIELRRWNTKFRGKFLIHSSKNPDEEAMKRFSFKELPCGFIMGEAELMDVKEYLGNEEFNKDNDKHLASKEWGSYGFILKNVKRIKPIEAKGQLGFWNFDLKEEKS